MKYLDQKTKNAILNAPSGTVVLLSAMVGSGKTSFILRELLYRTRLSQKKLLLVVNRVSLRGQLVQNACKQLGIPLEGLTLADNGYVALGPLVVMSYQYLSKRLSGGCRPEMKIGPYCASEYGVAVFDEAHHLLADALLSADSYTLMNIPKVFQATRIYMSATMEPVRKLIFKMENVADLWEEAHISDSEHARFSGLPCRYIQAGLGALNANGIWPRNVLELHGSEPDYSYLTPRIIGEDVDIAEDVLGLKAAGALKKAVIFVDSKEKGREIATRLRENGCPAAFVCSLSDTDMMSNDDLNTLSFIEEKGHLDSISVLIATTTLYNGVSLLDPDITHLYIEGVDYITAVQEAGRIRVPEKGRTVSLTIQRHGRAFFRRRLGQYKHICNTLNRFQRESDRGKFALFFSGEGKLIQCLVSYDEERRQFHYSPFVDYAFNYYISDLTDTIRLLEKDSDGYIKKALNWFGKKYDATDDEEAKSREQATLDLHEYLSSYLDSPSLMNGDKYKEFARKMVKYSQLEGASIQPARRDRPIPAVSVIREYLLKHGYIFEGTKNAWSIRKEVN